MAKTLRRLVRLAPLALFMFAESAIAQSTSSITGVVTDASTGKPVVGAVVVVTSPAADGEQTVVSEAGGKFTVPDLPPGDYTLSVQMDGYKPYERSDLVLKEATTLRANAQVVPEAVQMEEVVVTGSRIRRKDLTTPAPVTVINSEQIQATGKVTVGDFLQSLPEQGNTVNTQVNNGNDGSVNVSLRSLGENRTLVLVNGRRMVAGGTLPGVAPDLNTIPAAAIERIEILKDGASAVYGSDAVAGVVNVILKKHFDGVEASAYAGQSSHGDGAVYDVSAVGGTSGDRGSILFTLGYQEQQKVLAGDRNWSKTTYYYNPATGQRDPDGNSSIFPAGRFSIPDVENTCAAPPNPRVAALCTMWENSAPLVDDRTNSFVPDGAGGFTLYDGSYYNTNPTNYLLTPNRRIQVFSTGDLKVSDSVRAFYEASYVNRTSSQNLAPMPVTNDSIPTSPVSIDANSLYNPFGVDITSWKKRFMEFGLRRWTQDLDTFRAVVGIDGTLADWAGPLKGWTWDLSYNHGRTTGTEVNRGQIRMPNLAGATGPSMIDDVPGSSTLGKAICVKTAGDATTKIPGCIPINILGAFNDASAAPNTLVSEGNTLADLRKYLSFDGTLRSWNQQQVLSANASGELFKLWADTPAGLAFGADYRIESGAYEPDPITAAGESSGNNSEPTHGKYDVKELYAELSLPLLSNRPGVQELEVSAAVRYFDYSTFGSDSTYKLGARYSPVRDLTLRGTYSTAFRAPNINELYSGTQDSYEYALDPSGVDNNFQFLTRWLRNEKLKPETAKIYTAGMVFEPRWVKNMTFTLDYYDIRLDHSIRRHGTQNILNQCYGTDGTDGDPAYCAMVLRDENGQITAVADQIANLTKVHTTGLDYAFRYQMPMQSLGRLTFTLDGTYLLKYDETYPWGTISHAGNYDEQLAMPRWKWNAGIGWDLAGLAVGVSARYVGSYKECVNTDDLGNYLPCSEDASVKRTIKSYMPLDLTATYALKSALGKTSIGIGVQNVTNLKPPYIATANDFNSDPSVYDYIGRFYFGRLTQSF